MHPRPPLTLIVASTQSLGIGIRGALPWRLKSDLQYFARVTTRIPTEDSNAETALQTQQPPLIQNAVVMGRKTWESIPAKFRPLKGRLNVVLSSKAENGSLHDGALWACSLEGALGLLEGLSAKPEPTATIKILPIGEQVSTRATSASNLRLPLVARAFVIGGAAVYNAALALPQTTSVLRTMVYGDWECDTFFPVDLDKSNEWHMTSIAELREWTGEQIQEGKIKEGETEFRYTMYNKSRMSNG